MKFVLNCEFFKSIGQLEELDLKRLAQLLLNQTPGWTMPYPKVSVKKPSKNYFNCMASKQWVENRKKKHTVAKELHNLQPLMGLLDSNMKFDGLECKKFKYEYNVTRLTMAMVLSVPDTPFFSAYRQVRAKNKCVEEISEYAAHFFRKFPEVKGTFKLPAPILHTREFNSSKFWFKAWDNEYA